MRLEKESSLVIQNINKEHMSTLHERLSMGFASPFGDALQSQQSPHAATRLLTLRQLLAARPHFYACSSPTHGRVLATRSYTPNTVIPSLPILLTPSLEGSPLDLPRPGELPLRIHLSVSLLTLNAGDMLCKILDNKYGKYTFNQVVLYLEVP